MAHSKLGNWEQYDVLHAARGYGWDMILDWADYMVQEDVENISKASLSVMPGMEEKDFLSEYKQSGSFSQTDVLKNEYGLLNEGDVSGRWGGEEFMIMVRSSDESEVPALAEKIRETIASLDFEGPGHVTASLGVTKIRPGENADAAVIRVDKAMYEGKEQGRNRVVFK